MTTARLAHIVRHPIKGHGREEMGHVDLTAGACLPFDRHWAVAHEAARLTGAWVPCANFTRGAKALTLMAITSTLDAETRTVTLHHPEAGRLTFQPDDPAEWPRFLDWVGPMSPVGRAQPAQIVSVGRGMTDSEFPSVAILSMTTLRDMSARMGQNLSIHRWRGNLWLEGVPLRAEEDWPGRVMRIGGAVLRVEERITRCRATTADPETGLAAGDTLAALQAAYGHQDFGVYATVLEGGPVAVDDAWVLQ
jgi:uncharacterized protein